MNKNSLNRDIYLTETVPRISLFPLPGLPQNSREKPWKWACPDVLLKYSFGGFERRGRGRGTCTLAYWGWLRQSANDDFKNIFSNSLIIYQKNIILYDNGLTLNIIQDRTMLNHCLTLLAPDYQYSIFIYIIILMVFRYLTLKSIDFFHFISPLFHES